MVGRELHHNLEMTTTLTPQQVVKRALEHFIAVVDAKFNVSTASLMAVKKVEKKPEGKPSVESASTKWIFRQREKGPGYICSLNGYVVDEATKKISGKEVNGVFMSLSDDDVLSIKTRHPELLQPEKIEKTSEKKEVEDQFEEENVEEVEENEEHVEEHVEEEVEENVEEDCEEIRL